MKKVLRCLSAAAIFAQLGAAVMPAALECSSLCACAVSETEVDKWVDVTFDHFSAFGTSCMALTEQGNLYVWGEGEYINNKKTASGRLAPVKIDFEHKVVDIDSNYVLTDTGDVYFIKFDDIVPTATLLLSDVKTLCEDAAITNSGELYLLGEGMFAFYDGNGNTSEFSVVKVNSLENVVSACNTGSAVAAVTEDGTLYTWGSNQMGQATCNGYLGYYSNNPEYSANDQHELYPKKVDIENVADAKFSGLNLYVLKKDGTLYRNNYDYDSTIVSFDRVFENIKNFECDFSFHGGHEAMAIANNNELYVDGYSIWGFGDGNPVNDYNGISVKLSQFGTVRNVATSGDNFAVVSSDGNLYTWGDNSSGVVGNGKKTDGFSEGLGEPCDGDVFEAYLVPQPGIENNTKDDNNTSYSEAELKAKAEKYGFIATWEYHDYDGDGSSEAYFATTKSGEDWDDLEYVYFINSNGEITQMSENFGGFFYTGTEKYSECDGKGFFSFDTGGGGSGWDTMLYSVRDGKPYELDISGDLQGFYQDEKTGKFYTTPSDFSNGFHEYPEYELIYDSVNQQFSLGERLNLENSGQTDTTDAADNNTNNSNNNNGNNSNGGSSNNNSSNNSSGNSSNNSSSSNKGSSSNSSSSSSNTKGSSSGSTSGSSSNNTADANALDASPKTDDGIFKISALVAAVAVLGVAFSKKHKKN